MIKKIIMLVAILTLTLVVSACEIEEEDFNYVADNIGQLQAPTVSRDSAEYREKYATLAKYDEPVTITVAVCDYPLEADVKPGTSPINQTFNQIALEKLNIKLEYVLVADGSMYDQKLNMKLAAGTMPDMFYTTNASMYTQLLEGERLADLSDVFWYLNDELQENYLTYFPELLPTVMQDSKLYALPTITNTYATAQRLYVRQDWLDIVGMEAPTTMDEFLAVGQAFVDNKDKIAAATGIDAKRVIPFTMNKEITWAGSYSAEGFFNCFGTSIDSYFEDENGDLYYSNTSPEMKNALSTLRNMYTNKILDQEFISKSAEQIQTNIKAGYVGMVFGEWWMAKDVLDDCISARETANWTWVNLPAASGVESAPIVKSVGISGYNLISKDCEHPEAAARLINLFYDIYYSDDAQERYGDKVLPSNGFYYQYVPIKLWDGIASQREYYRVQEVFNELYEAGFKPRDYVDSALYNKSGIIETVASTQAGDYVISIGNNGTSIINRNVIAAINANATWKASFDKLRNREKTLHFADGYPYFVDYKDKVEFTSMAKGVKKGWGIYHEMVDPNGGYAYVVNLTEGKEKAKYDQFYGANLTSMLEYGEYISTQTNVMFTKIITSQMGLDEFDTKYVQDVYLDNGGDVILNQVNQWYDSQNIDYDNVYGLIK